MSRQCDFGPLFEGGSDTTSQRQSRTTRAHPLPASATAFASLILGLPVATLPAWGLINGDFSTGDFTGWTVSGIDANGQPATPLAEVVNQGGLWSAVLRTGEYGGGTFVTSMEQSLVLDPGRKLLSFDFLGMPTEQPNSGWFFQDTLTVSVSQGDNVFVLFTADATGMHADPFGTAPGMVSIAWSQSIPYMHRVFADLSALGGSTGPALSSPLGPAPGALRLSFDASGMTDGRFSAFTLANVSTAPQLGMGDFITKIPESSTPLWILNLLLLALVARRLQQSR